MLFSLGLLGTLAAICYVLLLPYHAYRRLRAASHATRHALGEEATGHGPQATGQALARAA